MSLQVRDALITDYDQINDLGRWFQENSLYKTCGWSDKKCYQMLISAINKEVPYFLRVVEKEGEIIGFFLGHMTEYFFSEKRMAQDLVMIFKPEHRDGIAKQLIQMMKEFYKWAERNKAHEICIGVTSGIAGSGYEKLIEKHGFKKVGFITKREV